MKNKILVIRFSSLGDIVLSSSFIKFIKKKFPDYRFFFLTKKLYKDIFQFFPVDLELLFLEDFCSLRELAKFIDNNKFDYIFDIHNNLRTNLLKFFVKQKIYSYKKKHLYRKYKIMFHKKKVDFYVYQQYFSVFRDYENIDYPKLELKRNIPFELDKNVIKIGIHPGASNLTKMWNIENLVSLINLLIEKDFFISVIYSNKEEFIIKELKNIFGDQINYKFTGNSLKELFEEIQKQNLMITMDSGASHISYSFGIPTISLFGATHPSLGFVSDIKENNFLTINEKCSPCTLHGQSSCPKKHFNCMKKLLPEMVFDKVIKILQDYYGVH